MEDQPKWKATVAFACFLALVGGVFAASVVEGLVLFLMGVDYLDLPFPAALVMIPVNETVILAITLLFARYKGVGLTELGLKRASSRVLAGVSVLAVFTYLAGVGISVGEEIVFGPDPMGGLAAALLVPRDILQLATIIFLSMFLVGPCEELAFRGFIQSGFEKSFGRTRGLLAASVLFGLMHGLNTLYAVFPTFVAGLIVGYVWQRSGGNTTVSAFMHGLIDTISLTVAFSLGG